MEQLRNDDGAARGLGGQDNLERARLYFERKAGRPVSVAEAREWLDSLVEYVKTAQVWAEEAAARETSGISSQDVQQAVQQDTQEVSLDIQGLPSPPASRRIAARGKARTSRRHTTQDTLSIPMDVHNDVQTARAAPTGARKGRE